MKIKKNKRKIIIRNNTTDQDMLFQHQCLFYKFTHIKGKAATGENGRALRPVNIKVLIYVSK